MRVGLDRHVDDSRQDPGMVVGRRLSGFTCAGDRWVEQARNELYYLRRAGDLAPLERRKLEGILSGELRR